MWIATVCGSLRFLFPILIEADTRHLGKHSAYTRIIKSFLKTSSQSVVLVSARQFGTRIDCYPKYFVCLWGGGEGVGFVILRHALHLSPLSRVRQTAQQTITPTHAFTKRHVVLFALLLDSVATVMWRYLLHSSREITNLQHKKNDMSFVTVIINNPN